MEHLEDQSKSAVSHALGPHITRATGSRGLLVVGMKEQARNLASLCPQLVRVGDSAPGCGRKSSIFGKGSRQQSSFGQSQFSESRGNIVKGGLCVCWGVLSWK